jgi:hypothetical protein
MQHLDFSVVGGYPTPQLAWGQLKPWIHGVPAKNLRSQGGAGILYQDKRGFLGRMRREMPSPLQKANHQPIAVTSNGLEVNQEEALV